MQSDECGRDDTRAPTRLRGTAFWLLSRVTAQAQRLTLEALEEAGMRRYFYGILATLEEFGPAAQADIGRRLGVDPSIMVAALGELEELTYVSRDRDPSDRRRNVVTLTAAGNDALKRFDKSIAKAERQLLSVLDKSQQRQLIESLKTIVLRK